MLVRDENVTVDDFIDVIKSSNILYIKCSYVHRPRCFEECDRLAREPNTVVMSCELDLGIDDLKEETGCASAPLHCRRGDPQPNFMSPWWEARGLPANRCGRHPPRHEETVC